MIGNSSANAHANANAHVHANDNANFNTIIPALPNIMYNLALETIHLSTRDLVGS